MKRMLINATHAEELRVAIVDGQRLHDLDIENKARQQKKSNIYKARVTRIEPSLEAAFVDYGAERHGFLPFKEIAREYLSEDAFSGGGRPNVKEGLKEGKELIVQIEKEERGNKGAALTTFISLAGRFLVLMPNNPRAGGVSRRIEGEDRANLRAAMNDVVVAEEMGTIVRTAGIGRTTEELQWDLDYQVDIWKAIQQAADNKKAPFLIYQESNVIVRALRDNFRSDIGEILIDEPEVHEQAKEFIERYMPHNARKLKLYQETVPLFSRFQIESQIESAFQREVQLPSGGAIVIDHTEALISIDINSARATKGGDIEETATNTNLEACDEIARQLRLRDNGGLIVIDFIDMLANKNQRKVEARLKEVMKVDRARVQIGRISRFGLMEMSRQRLRPSLGESSQQICPRCSGQGTIRGIESLSLSILRLLEEEAMKDNTGRVMVRVPVDVGSYLVNEKRENIAEIETRTQVELLIIPSPGLETPHYQLERIRANDEEHESQGKKSYELSINVDEPYVPGETQKQTPVAEAPAVSRVVPEQPAPTPAAGQAAAAAAVGPTRDANVVSKIIGAFSNLFSAETKTEDEDTEAAAEKPRQNQSGNTRGRGGNKDSGTSGRSGNTRRRGKTAKKPASKTEGESDKSSDENNAKSRGNTERSGNEEKSGRSRSRGRRGGRRGSGTENKAARGKENANGSEENSVESQSTAPENDAETTEKPSRNSRQRQGGNRSRRQDGRQSKKNQDGDNTAASDNRDASAKRQSDELTKDAASHRPATEPSADAAPKEPPQATVAKTSNGDADSSTDGKAARVSTKQPSQLKSTVRSLANKPEAEKAEAGQPDPVAKPEAKRGKTGANAESATSTAAKPASAPSEESASGDKDARDSKPKQSRGARSRSRDKASAQKSSETAATAADASAASQSAADKSETAAPKAAQAAPKAEPKKAASEAAEKPAEKPKAAAPRRKNTWGSPKPAAQTPTAAESAPAADTAKPASEPAAEKAKPAAAPKVDRSTEKAKPASAPKAEKAKAASEPAAEKAKTTANPSAQKAKVDSTPAPQRASASVADTVKASSASTTPSAKPASTPAAKKAEPAVEKAAPAPATPKVETAKAETPKKVETPKPQTPKASAPKPPVPKAPAPKAAAPNTEASGAKAEAPASSKPASANPAPKPASAQPQAEARSTTQQRESASSEVPQD